MVFNRNKMRILKPDFWKEHFPIQLFYRLFNHFSEFKNSEVPSDNVKNNRWARVKCPIFGPWKPANVCVLPIFNLPILISFSDDDFFASEYYLLLDYLKTVNIIFDATRLFFSSS